MLMMPPSAAPPEAEPSIFMKVDMTKISTARGDFVGPCCSCDLHGLSSASTSSLPSLISSASTASSRCSGFVMPSRTEVIHCLLNSQARATYEDFASLSFAIPSSASSTSKSSGLKYPLGKYLSVLYHTVSGFSFLLYLPERNSLPSGLYGAMAIPNSLHTGMPSLSSSAYLTLQHGAFPL